MANDALTAALLGGSGNAEVNPFMLVAAPELHTAQQLQQAGMSTAPAYAPQALGRLAQALAGTYLQHANVSDLAKAMSGEADSMAGILEQKDPGNVLIPALRSPNLATRFMALQTAPKVITGLGLPSDVGRGTVRATGVGAPNPYPLSAPGEAALDAVNAARDGQPALANAISAAGVSKPAMIGETGMSAPPVPINGPRPQGPGATPAVAIPPPEAKSLPMQIGEAKAATTAPQKASDEFNAEKTQKSFNSAQNVMRQLDTMDHYINALGPSWMGAGADAKANFGKGWNSFLDTFGVKGAHIDPQKIADWEAFNKETKQAGMQLISSNFGGSREAQMIVKMGTEAVPSSSNTYLGAKMNSAAIRAATQHEIDLHNYKSALQQQGKSLVGADDDFNKQSPPERYAAQAILQNLPPKAIADLKANPRLRDQFDQKYGQGIPGGVTRYLIQAQNGPAAAGQ